MWNWTNSLVFHACEDNVEHLCERCLRGGLVDEVAAGQVDIVAGSDCQEHRALMNLDVRRGHSRQQGLDRDERKSWVIRLHMVLLLLHLLNHPSTSLLLWHVKAQTLGWHTHTPLHCVWWRIQLFLVYFDVTQKMSFKLKKIIRKTYRWLIHLHIIYCSSLYKSVSIYCTDIQISFSSECNTNINLPYNSFVNSDRTYNRGDFGLSINQDVYFIHSEVMNHAYCTNTRQVITLKKWPGNVNKYNQMKMD